MNFVKFVYLIQLGQKKKKKKKKAHIKFGIWQLSILECSSKLTKLAILWKCQFILCNFSFTCMYLLRHYPFSFLDLIFHENKGSTISWSYRIVKSTSFLIELKPAKHKRILNRKWDSIREHSVYMFRQIKTKAFISKSITERRRSTRLHQCLW